MAPGDRTRCFFLCGGDLLYTQEQRGDEEVVSCYRVSTGQPVWQHRDQARYWEAHAGAGPRSTPTLNDGHVYTFGATGLLNALDADDGSLLWSRDVAGENDVKLPPSYGWYGFSSSPLVVDDIMIVAASGTVFAYDLANGNPRWISLAGRTSYSSPQVVTIDGVRQILLLSFNGTASVAPEDGALLWEYPLPVPIVQPALTGNGDLLLSEGGMVATAMHRITVHRGPGGWDFKERWSSTGLKPYFNDFVVHDGHAYGFDGPILSCIELEEGKREWKGGRYGNGQLILLAEQDLLLVLSEQGELALVEATPDLFSELARFPAIEGKTWNHPVLVGDVLLVRNSQEMAAFRLFLAGN